MRTVRSTAATSAASESNDSINALCALDIPTVKIGPQEDPFAVVNNIGQEEAPLTKIEGMTIEKFIQWDESPSRRGRLFFYSSEREVLIIKLPISEIHEYLHRALEWDIIYSLSRALKKETRPYGSATFYMKRDGRVTAAGEGDSSLGLAAQGANDGWPTVVIEAGWSQTRTALVAKAHWWFEASNRAVKMVLLITVSPLQIQVEKWNTSSLPQSTAPGRPKTRQSQREATDLRPKIHPPILTINRTSANTTNDCRVIGSPLRLEFRHIFLRNPVPPEGDILLDESFFRMYAEQAWSLLE
ncbi:unnamed protein product [Clonostachys rosea]|uniref:Uncharacterized protein n=1 Tax=Bionectria ochroleuca TaxID=29856 RepID=A0ABY6TQ32_BIOOC|nr:unnamed protein product [Clonostachys rosea]